MAETISLVLNVDTSAGKTAVKGLSDEVSKLKTTADQTTPALANTTKETKAFSDKATQTKGAVAALAAAMGMISPEAQRAVQGLGNVSGALGGVGKAALALGASAGPLAILAAAVGAIAIAWKLVGDQAKAAEEKQAASAKKATERLALSNVKDRQKLEAGYKSGKIDEATYQETLANSAGDAAYADRFTDINARLQTARQAASGSELSNVSHDEAVTRKNAVKNLEQEYAQAVQEKKDFINDAFVVAVSNAPAEEKKDTAAAEAKAKKLGENAVALQLKAVSSGMQSGIDSLASKGNTFGAGSDAAFAISNGFKLPSGGYSLGGAGGTGNVAAFGGYELPTFEQGYVRATSANVTNGYDPNDPRTFGRDLGNLGMGTLSLAGGNMGGALASLGPAGAIVGGVQTIGTMGAEGVDEQLTALKDVLIEALHELPAILSEVIPEFVTAIISELIPALINAMPEILKSLLIDLPIAIAKAIASALNPFDNGAMSNNKKGFNDFAAEWFTLGAAKTDFGGGWGGKSHAVGNARVSSDGLAMIHQDEAVLTRAQADDWRSGRGSGGGGATHVYQINGPVGDAAFRQIIMEQTSAALGPGGVGYSTGLSGGIRGT